MNPTFRYALRAGLVGLVAAASSVQAALPGLSPDEIIQAVCAGIVGVGVYAGIGYGTPLEPSVGKKA